MKIRLDNVKFERIYRFYQIREGQVMTRASRISRRTSDGYQEPSAAQVRLVAEECGLAVAKQRWRESLTPRQIVDLIYQAGGQVGRLRHTFSAADLDHIISTTTRLRSVVRTSRALGISQEKIYRAHWQAGVPWPKLTTEERSQATRDGIAKRRRQRRARNGRV